MYEKPKNGENCGRFGLRIPPPPNEWPSNPLPGFLDIGQLQAQACQHTAETFTWKSFSFSGTVKRVDGSKISFGRYDSWMSWSSGIEDIIPRHISRFDRINFGQDLNTQSIGRRAPLPWRRSFAPPSTAFSSVFYLFFHVDRSTPFIFSQPLLRRGDGVVLGDDFGCVTRRWIGNRHVRKSLSTGV